MTTRREFLAASALGLWGISSGVAPVLAQPSATRKKLAVVTTLWNNRSHAWHMAERFLHGYPWNGRWHRPAIDVVSAYVDQQPESDLSRQRAEEFGFTIYPTIAEALRCGGSKLAVDAVLVIGEHGDYPHNEYGQKLYPRFEFFQQVDAVFQADGRAVPVFNDKHLSWDFDKARTMVETAKTRKFPFLAGSSLPVTWRMPDLDLPLGAEVEEILCVAFGGVDVYDFHALEAMQCLAERRRGGETGVVALQALRGDKVWAALESGSWQAGGWSPQLFEACLSRSQTLRQPETFSHRYPTVAQMREWVKDPVCYRYEYADGTKATMLLMNGLVQDFNLAFQLKGESQPQSTMFHLPPNPNVVYSAGLMHAAETMFLTGEAPYPVERTLLTSGLVQAGLQSLAKGQERRPTPHLNVQYSPPKQASYMRQ